MANALDAVLDSRVSLDEAAPPLVTSEVETMPLRGRVYFDGKIGVTWAIDIKRVCENEDFVDSNSNSACEYFDCKNGEPECGYRVSLAVKNFGAAMPMEAWVSSHSTKDPTTSKPVTIGGFGYDLVGF